MNGGDTPAGGVHPVFVGSDDLLVAKPRWNQLAGTRAVVGQCRDCGGDLQAIEATEYDSMGEAGQVTWYETRCRVCGKERAAPNGRIMRRSSAHRETPRAWLDTRERRDADERKQSRQVH
jgi:hypothetical protein